MSDVMCIGKDSFRHGMYLFNAPCLMPVEYVFELGSLKVYACPRHQEKVRDALCKRRGRLKVTWLGKPRTEPEGEACPGQVKA